MTKYIIHATITIEGEPEPELILTRRFSSEDTMADALEREAAKACRELRKLSAYKIWRTA